MRPIVISSKYLQQKLSEIDFDNDYVVDVIIKGETLTFHTTEKNVEVELSENYGNMTFEQIDRGWDSVLKVCSQIDEQPICLQIYENVINIIIQY